jgi:hypothetical protein
MLSGKMVVLLKNNSYKDPVDRLRGRNIIRELSDKNMLNNIGLIFCFP